MKRTVLRPPGPGIAAITAHSQSSRSSETHRPPGDRPPGNSQLAKTPPDRQTDNRITLAVLEQHPGGRGNGYDPYNASASPLDVAAWKRRQKPG